MVVPNVQQADQHDLTSLQLETTASKGNSYSNLAYCFCYSILYIFSLFR